MVFKSLDGSFGGIPEMYIWGNKLVRDLYIKEGILEKLTIFIIHYLELGIVSSSCECVKKFFDPFVDACA